MSTASKLRPGGDRRQTGASSRRRAAVRSSRRYPGIVPIAMSTPRAPGRSADVCAYARGAEARRLHSARTPRADPKRLDHRLTAARLAEDMGQRLDAFPFATWLTSTFAATAPPGLKPPHNRRRAACGRAVGRGRKVRHPRMSAFHTRKHELQTGSAPCREDIGGTRTCAQPPNRRLPPRQTGTILCGQRRAIDCSAVRTTRRTWSTTAARPMPMPGQFAFPSRSIPP